MYRFILLLLLFIHFFYYPPLATGVILSKSLNDLKTSYSFVKTAAWKDLIIENVPRTSPREIKEDLSSGEELSFEDHFYESEEDILPNSDLSDDLSLICITQNFLDEMDNTPKNPRSIQEWFRRHFDPYCQRLLIATQISIIDISFFSDLFPSIKDLKLAYPLDYFNWDEDRMKYAISKFPNLQKIDLSNHEISNQCVRELAGLSHLRKLRLSNCSLQNEEAITLAKNFKFWPKLKKLDLSDNLIEDDGAVMLISAVQNLTELKDFSFEYNCIGSKTIHFMSSIKDYLKRFTVLSFRGNQLLNEGIKALAELLPFIPDLEVLDISENDIDDEGIVFILKILDELPHLKVLYITNDNFNKGKKIWIFC